MSAKSEKPNANKKMSFAEYIAFWGFVPLICCDGCSWRRECFDIETCGPCKEYKALCGYDEGGAK